MQQETAVSEKSIPKPNWQSSRQDGVKGIPEQYQSNIPERVQLLKQ